ncbi:MAG: hypothetical protein AB7M05_16035 [Alphaproteobacteria bacterium]
MILRLLLAVAAVIAFAAPIFAFIPPPPPPPPPAPPPMAPPPVIVPGIQALPSAVPTMQGMASMPQMSCNFCQIGSDDDGEALKRLAEADERVMAVSRKVAPDRPDEFERRMAAARKCGGSLRRLSKASPDCQAWRTAVEERANACTALETRRSAKPPKSPAGGNASPAIEMGATEQAGQVGKKFDVVGVVGNFNAAPKVRVNGKKVQVIETRSGDGSAASVTRSFKIAVPTARPGTGIYVVEARDGANACFGKDLIARIQE